MSSIGSSMAMPRGVLALLALTNAYMLPVLNIKIIGVISCLHLKPTGPVQPNGNGILSIDLKHNPLLAFCLYLAYHRFQHLSAVSAPTVPRADDKAINADLAVHLIQPQASNRLFIKHTKVERLIVLQ